MIPKVANKKLTKCQEKSDEEFQKYPSESYCLTADVNVARFSSVPINTLSPLSISTIKTLKNTSKTTNYQSSTEINVFENKFGDKHHENSVVVTDKATIKDQEEEELKSDQNKAASVSLNRDILPHHVEQPLSVRVASRCLCGYSFPINFCRWQIPRNFSSSKHPPQKNTVFVKNNYTLFALQQILLLVLVTNQQKSCYVNAQQYPLQQQQENNFLLLVQNNQPEEFVSTAKGFQNFNQPYQDDPRVTSDHFKEDLGEFPDEKDNDVEGGTEFVGCLFSDNVCTQEEICFDDLILGRCISAEYELDEDEGLQPLSTDDQSFLEAEVERLLEQGFHWDDPYTQCVLQTLIGSFHYYGLEYDISLCKAALLPSELSIERRVDVPKKFILPNYVANDVVDSTIDNTNNLKLFPDDVLIDQPEEDEIKKEGSYLSAFTKSNNEKREQQNEKKKRNQLGNHPILLTGPDFTNFQNEDNFQIDQPNVVYQPQPIFSQNEDNYNDDQEGRKELDLNISPLSPRQYPHPILNFLIHQEDDGGILIEPDHDMATSSSASSSSNNDQVTDDNREEEESDYIIQPPGIPDTRVETSYDTPSISTKNSFQIPSQRDSQQMKNLIWIANNIRKPEQLGYQDSPQLQQQQNPFAFLPPAIWLGDRNDEGAQSLGSNNNINVNVANEVPDEWPTTDVDEEGFGLRGPANNFVDQGNFYLDGDLMSPLNVKQEEPEKIKRGDPLADNNTNKDDEEELLYVPLYSDSDQEFLQRHKFSTLSKRSSNSLPDAPPPKEEVEEFKETYEYPVMVSMEGKEVPSVHHTIHEAEEPSGLRKDLDIYEPTLMEDKDTSGLYNKEDMDYYDEEQGMTNPDYKEDWFLRGKEIAHENENSLGSFTFNRKERLDVKKPGPFFPNSENNFFFEKLLASDNTKEKEKRDEEYDIDDSGKTKDQEPSAAIIGDPFGPRRSNYSEDGKGQMEYEMPLQVLNPDPKKRFLMVHEVADSKPEEELQKQQQQAKKFLHLMMKKRFDKWQQGMDLVDVLADELGVPRHALHDERIDDHHVQFRVDPNPQNIDAEKMAHSLDNDIILKKRISDQIGVEVAQAAAGDRNDYDVSKFPATAINNILYIVLVATSTLAILILSAAILVLTRHCVRRRRQNDALNKVHKQDVLESERGKVQEEYKQLCRDWSKKSTVQPGEPATKTSLVSDGSKSSPTSAAIKKVQGQDSKTEGSNRSSTSSWNEEPTSTNMDISTGHMVLAYMEDHLKNKQRLEQEWVALCGYEAEPCATTIAFKTENKKKNRYPDKLPYDHNRVILNAVLNGSNSDYINASSVTDHDPRNPSYIVSQGPLAQTVADFWQMIWEQGCVVIVMLSRLQDNGYQLCHRYWPEEGSEQYHIFEVHLVSEHVWCDDYLVRSVYLKNTRTGETRTVTQFHFRSWSAQSVPSSTKALLEFRRKVNKSYRGRSAPICVHCSDGVGRAGTYVLIDMVLNRMAKGCKEIDIAATLEHIRDQRSGMVQTRPQFEFCLMAVAEEVHAILKALLP